MNYYYSSHHIIYRFSADVGHDPHILYTLSAIQILTLCNSLHLIEPIKIGNYIHTLQLDNGSFIGDQWGEVDTRFSYCSLSSLSILGILNDNYIDTIKAAYFISQ